MTLQIRLKPHVYSPQLHLTLGKWQRDGKPVLQGEDKGGEPETDSVCQLLWCKHFQHSRCQAPDKTSLNTELIRKGYAELAQASQCNLAQYATINCNCYPRLGVSFPSMILLP